MEFTPAKLNLFTFFKLPSAFWSGVRVKSISPEVCEVTVKHRQRENQPKPRTRLIQKQTPKPLKKPQPKPPRPNQQPHQKHQEQRLKRRGKAKPW